MDCVPISLNSPFDLGGIIGWVRIVPGEEYREFARELVRFFGATIETGLGR